MITLKTGSPASERREDSHSFEPGCSTAPSSEANYVIVSSIVLLMLAADDSAGSVVNMVITHAVLHMSVAAFNSWEPSAKPDWAAAVLNAAPNSVH